MLALNIITFMYVAREHIHVGHPLYIYIVYYHIKRYN